ncbi:uncharacterized mitochondrial protein AtMg00810-like [Juglans microcarpa x Juglans regia]|uniref:uncharacterized mitochondrial protein AtMg00810-like n=1 Tax=Juglans microcarpa x Juglans regia TaxID=2249226 RepID=UPI001B7F0F83|nr:uncharacterized mitochondrial protein AtMg00810-like [Juglans microcarpa x Juglans regia]
MHGLLPWMKKFKLYNIISHGFWSLDLPTAIFLVPNGCSGPNTCFMDPLSARDILTRVQLLDSKPVHTPMVISQHLTGDGPAFLDPTLYRSLVGALQYLTITRPNIAHVVNSISQFLHAPTTDHFLAIKHILRYVKGTLHFGLTFRPSATSSALVAYSDVDWVGCPDTHRSTSGYFIYLGDNLVS